MGSSRLFGATPKKSPCKLTNNRIRAEVRLMDLHQRELYRFISSLSIRSRAVLVLTVFCLFATLGFVGDVLSVGRHTAARIALDVAFSGVVAVLYAFVGTRSGRALAAVGASQVVAAVLIAKWSPVFLADAPVRIGADLAAE